MRQLSDLLTDIMLRIVEAQTDPKEKAAMLAIMRKDGHLPVEREAA